MLGLMAEIKQRLWLRSTSTALVSGVLVASVWLPPHRPWALGFAFVPLFVSWIRAERWQDILVPGLLTQWLVSAIAFSWIGPAVRVYHDLSLTASVGVWLGAAAVTNLHLPLIGLAWWAAVRRYQLSPAPASCLLACGWVGFSQFYPTFVPFDYGYPWLWSELPIQHLADLIGFRGLAIVTMLLNAWIAYAVCSSKRRQRLRLIAGAAGLAAGTNLFGLLHGAQWEEPDASLRVALIQPSFSIEDTLRAHRDQQVDARRVLSLLNQSKGHQADEPADLWVWPESSIITPVAAPGSKPFEAWLSSLLATPSVPILTGMHWATGPRSIHNSAVLFDRKGQVHSAYHKRNLFPFGEYIPFFEGANAARVHYEPGTSSDGGTVDLEGVRLGLSICFEGLFPEHFRRSADRGAQVFVNLSNDQAFGNTAERYQHFYMTRARAIEFRRPVVRAALNGVSAAIGHDGAILASGDMDQVWAATVRLPYFSSQKATFYQRFGYLFEHASALVTLLSLGLLELRRSSGRTSLQHAEAAPAAKKARRTPRPASEPSSKVAFEDLRAASRDRLTTIACVALTLVGIGQALGRALGWPYLEVGSLLTAASPFPLVFGSIRGHEYWASEHQLDLRLGDGTEITRRITHETFGSLPGPHREHVFLAVPFMAPPASPAGIWRGILTWGLCDSGPISIAEGLPAPVHSAVLRSVDRTGSSYARSIQCRM